MKANDACDGKTKIHNVRFYNLSSRSINCMAYNKITGKIALSRSDSSIEIWDISHAPFLEKTISGDDGSIEGLVWAGENRLFSAGLNGYVTEWDLNTLDEKQMQHITGNAIWCLDVNKDESLLAAGTEEGFLNLLDITDDSLLYKNIFDKQEGRILCCKFDESGEFLVTGSIDAIRIWNTKTGHAIRKMTTGRTEAKKETIVWTLQILKDLTIISGDSRGQVCLWDGKQGVQIESYQFLPADILTIAVNEEEDLFMCSGVAPIIRMFALTTITKIDQVKKKWINFSKRQVHDHDIKALLCVGSKVISGSVDGYIGITSNTDVVEKAIKYGPFLQSPCATVAPEARFILLRYCTYLEIWRLGRADSTSLVSNNDEKKLLSLEVMPEKLLALRSKDDATIISATISPNGLWLIYSTKNSVRLFTFNNVDEKYQLSRIKDHPSQLNSFNQAVFSHDSTMLYLVKRNNQIDIFNMISSDAIDYVETIETSKYIKDVIHLVALSNCGKYIAVAGTCRNISVWKKQKKWKHHLNLPKYFVPTTAIALHQFSPRIVATFTDGKIFEYDLKEMRFTCSDTIKAESMDDLDYHYMNILLDSRNENVIMLQNDTSLLVLQKVYNDENDEGNVKKMKSEKDFNENVANLKLTLRKPFEHLVHLSSLSKDEMVAVNVNPVSLIAELPPGMRLKKFAS